MLRGHFRGHRRAPAEEKWRMRCPPKTRPPISITANYRIDTTRIPFHDHLYMSAHIR